MERGDRLEQLVPSESRKCFTEALRLSRRTHNTYQEVSILINLGILNLHAGRYDSAAAVFEEGLVLARAQNFQDKIGVCIFNIGNSDLYRNRPEKAIERYLEATSYLARDTGRLALIYANMAGVFWNLHQNTRALEYGEKGIMYALASHKPANISHAYANTAHVLEAIPPRTKAEAYYKKALVFAKQVSDMGLRTTSYQNLADYYREGNDLLLAMKYSDSSLHFARKSNDAYRLSHALNVNGLIHLNLGHYAVAEPLLYEALRRAEKGGEWMLLREIYYNLATLEKHYGRHRKAFAHMEKYIAFKDSSFYEESTEKIRVMEAKYESEKKEQQIKQLQSDKEIQALSIRQKNILNYMLLSILLIVLTLAGFAYSIYRQKQLLQRKKIKELETEKKLTATEAILKGQEDERSRLAKDLHDGLGGMLSGVKYSFQKVRGDYMMTGSALESFQRSIDMLDSSIHELRRVAHNLMPESLVKYGLSAAISDYCTSINNSGALTITYQHFHVDHLNLDQSKSNILYRIVQELINNILKHAAAKTAIVQLARQKHELAITVEDDGKGFDTTLLRQGRGMGWNNIYSRINYLKGSLDIKSEPGKGTYVNITIKI